MQKYFVAFKYKADAGNQVGFGYTFAKARGAAVERARAKAHDKTVVSVWCCKIADFNSQLEQIFGEGEPKDVNGVAQSLLIGARGRYEVKDINVKKEQSKKKATLPEAPPRLPYTPVKRRQGYSMFRTSEAKIQKGTK